MTGKTLEWSRFLLTAADEQFFQIMRTYLGDIKTPYNKHTLIKRLNSFLRKPDSVERILSLVDTRDARVLTAIAFLDEPSIGRLYTLFEDSTRYLQLHYHVLNLEERLLVYRREGEGQERVALNPLLAEAMLERVISSTLLFPAKSVKPVSAHLRWPSDARIIATVSFVCGVPSLLKGDGALRKKVASEVKSVFHEGLRNDEYDGFRSTVLRLIELGVLSRHESSLELDLHRWREFCSIDGDSRRAYLASDDFAESTRSLMTNMPCDAAMEQDSFERFLRAHASQPLGDTEAESLTERFLALGMLVRRDDGTLSRPRPLAEGSGTALIQPTFELTLPLESSAAEAWFLPLIAEVKGFDTVSRFELTRSACSRAFEAGMNVSTLRELLSSLCNKEVPHNVSTTLELWEQEYRSIRLIQATTVVVDDSHRHLFDFDEQIQALIHETVAPGVYLVMGRNVEAMRKRLERAGIDPVPTVESSEQTGEIDEAGPTRLKTFSATEAIHLAIGEESVKSLSFEPEAYRREILGYADHGSLTKEQAAELDERIGRRLVLFPEQIKRVHPTTEVIEAKGFDYLGKIRLIEQALSSGNDLLEIIGSDESNEPTKIIVKPQELEKKGDELILVGRVVGDDSIHRIRVRTIGLLRKRRGSLLA